jgi:hypothetical protein
VRRATAWCRQERLVACKDLYGEQSTHTQGKNEATLQIDQMFYRDNLVIGRLTRVPQTGLSGRFHRFGNLEIRRLTRESLIGWRYALASITHRHDQPHRMRSAIES